MTSEEFKDKIWNPANRSRSMLERALIAANKVDTELENLLKEAQNAVCRVQARCAKLTKIGTQTMTKRNGLEWWQQPASLFAMSLAVFALIGPIAYCTSITDPINKKQSYEYRLEMKQLELEGLKIRQDQHFRK